MLPYPVKYKGQGSTAQGRERRHYFKAALRMHREAGEAATWKWRSVGGYVAGSVEGGVASCLMSGAT